MWVKIGWFVLGIKPKNQRSERFELIADCHCNCLDGRGAKGVAPRALGWWLKPTQCHRIGWNFLMDSLEIWWEEGKFDGIIKWNEIKS